MYAISCQAYFTLLNFFSASAVSSNKGRPSQPACFNRKFSAAGSCTTCMVSLVQCILTFPKYKALPVNEYLDAVIIIQLCLKLPLLAAWHTSFACPKQVSRKRHPTMPALRAPLRCSAAPNGQQHACAYLSW